MSKRKPKLINGPSQNGHAEMLPPHDLANECKALACILDCDQKTARDYFSKLEENYFYGTQYRTIFRALTQIEADGDPFNEVELLERIQANGGLDHIGGIQTILDLKVESAAMFPSLLGILKEKAQRRGIIKRAQEEISRAYDLAVEPDSISKNGLPELIEATDFLQTPISPPPELIEGILHKGSKFAFAGSSKSFKTWCLLDLAISIATGADWLGRKTQQGKVLFLNFEIQPHAWQRRIAVVARAKGIELKSGQITLWNLRGHAADFRQIIPRIIKRCKSENFALNILDPIYKLYGGTDENAAGDVAELLNSIEKLANETGSAVAFGAHFAKGNASTKEAIDRISGSGVFARDPDSLLIFTKHQEKDAFTVEPILRNFPQVEPFVVRWNFPLMESADDLDPEKLKQSAGRKREYDPAKLLSYVIDNDSENPISISEWAELAEMPRKTLADYLAEMRQKGWIITIGYGNTAKQTITNEGKAFANKYKTGGN